MMKNKHLVLFFLSVLFGGILFRQLPPPSGADFRREIIRIAPDSVTQIVLFLTNDADAIVFDRRLDTLWTATHKSRTVGVSTEKMNGLLASISQITSKNILTQNSDNQDVFEQFGQASVHLQVFSNAQKLDEFALAGCNSAAKSSLVKLNNSPEIFEVDGPLTCLWTMQFDDLRSHEICDCAPEQFISLSFSWTEFPPLYLEEKTDGQWQTPGRVHTRTAAEMQAFFQTINQLKIKAFADDFDDARRKELLVGRVVLNRKNSAHPPVELSCFASEKRSPFYVLHSSENPGNYFFTDDSLVMRIFLQPAEWASKPK